MTYEELAVLQYGRSKSFAEAQTEAMAAYCQAEHDLKQLQAENAKLRELVRDMLRNMHGCTFHHDCGSCGFDECIYEARARELGVDA